MVNNLGFVHMHMKCQSGETADTLAALRMAKEKNITTMAKSGISIILGTLLAFFVSWIFCAKWFSQVMVKLFHKTPNDNIWRDVLDLRNGSNLKLYIREEDYYVMGHHRNIEEKGDDSWIVLTGFVKLNKSDNTELESHKGDNKSMIAIRLADIEYAEIFN